MKLEGKVVLVTGGASGIGRALCERFAREGARGITVADQNGAGAESVANGIGRAALGVACDVASAQENEDLVRRTEKAFGPVDLFCCNAGIATGGDPLETPLDVWQRQWDVNLMAHVHALRAALPGMLARGSGHFLHTASMAGILSSHGNLVYAATKHAVVGLAEWLSITYHHRGVRFACLCPLGVRTPMLGDVDSPWAKAAAGPDPRAGRSRSIRRRRARGGAVPDPDRPAGTGVDGWKGEGPRALAARHAPDSARARAGARGAYAEILAAVSQRADSG